MFDSALEKSRRLAWGKYFGERDRVAAERLRTLELAVLVDELGLEHLDVSDIIAEHDPFVVANVRRYVRFRYAA